MKNILLIWLTALIPLFTVGQKLPAVVEIDLSGYATKEQVDRIEKRINSLEVGGVVKPVEPVLSKCKEGPVPVAITKITSTSANVTFHGAGVTNLDWRVVSAQDTTKLHSFGNHQPTSNQFPISYAGLAPGQYRLLLIGVNCTGVGGRNFTVPGIISPVVNCPRGPNIESVIGNKNGAIVKFDGDGVVRLVVETRSATGSFTQADTINPSSSQVSVRYNDLSPGTYLVRTQGVSCKGGSLEYKSFTVGEDAGGGGVDPPNPVRPDLTEYVENGVYHKKVAGRLFSYNKTPEFTLKFNSDGSITDVTPGLENGQLGGRNVFYAIDNKPVEASGGGYVAFEDINLFDGAYTLQQYVCDPNKVANFDQFVAGFNGWGNHGVNADNARRSQIFLTIHSDIKQGTGVVPNWLRISRTLQAPKHIVQKDWRKYYKFNGIGDRNMNDDISVYHKAGIATHFGNGDVGDALWRTNRMHPYYQPTDNELYGWGRGEVTTLGRSINSSTTSEFVENTYGQDKTEIHTRLWNYYKGFDDEMKKLTGINDTRMFGAFGDYGGDDWFGAYGAGISAGYDNFKRSLTDMLYGGYYPPENRWFSDKVVFYDKDINYRNLNYKLYYDNQDRMIPYHLLYINERIKLGTKTYEGQDRERNVILFTSPKTESFVSRADGTRNNIEVKDTGEIIPYANGEILTQVNHQPPAPIGSMFNDVLWAHLVAGGAMNWDAGGIFGEDSTVFDAWDGFEHAFSWRRKGETEFQRYNPGLNGAPQKSSKGYINRLYALPLDAHMAAAEVAWQYRDKTTKLSHVTYSSDLNSYTPTPGSKGLHLNGFGEINRDQYNSYEIFNKKKGIALLGEGPAGRVLIYYNGFLSKQLKETVTIMGITFKAQGGQTVILDL
jgi:hypothetical protein